VDVLFEEYGLGVEHIVAAAKRAIGRRGRP
jgi:hypothetical protein